MPLDPNARACLLAVHAHCRSLQTCSDTGLSCSLRRRHPRVCHFETRYLAPGLFCFAFEAPHPSETLRQLISRSVVGHDGGPATLARPGSLDLAVAMATGISSGTAHTVAALLFAEIGDRRLLDSRLGAEGLRIIPSAPPALRPDAFAAPGIAL